MAGKKRARVDQNCDDAAGDMKIGGGGGGGDNMSMVEEAKGVKRQVQGKTKGAIKAKKLETESKGQQVDKVEVETPQEDRPEALLNAEAGARPIRKDFNTLETFVSAVLAAKNIVVVTGAGVSVSCGIPDFRSENGVYNMVQKLDLGLSSAEDLFDLEFFKENPQPFFKFAKELYPGEYLPSRTHLFIKHLEEKKKLLRNYTQNIDGLEAVAGIKKHVACHGNFATASCLKCKKKYDAQDIRPEVMRQEVPRCRNRPLSKAAKLSAPTASSSSSSASSASSYASATTGGDSEPGPQRDLTDCNSIISIGNTTNTFAADSENDLMTSNTTTTAAAPATKAAADSKTDSTATNATGSGKSKTGSLSLALCNGVIKPAITFFGEKLSLLVSRSLEADRHKADLLIIIGTSLKVAPVSRIIQYMPRDIPQVLINRELVKPPKMISDGFDLHLLGNCDDVIDWLNAQLQWPGGCSGGSGGDGGGGGGGVDYSGGGGGDIDGEVVVTACDGNTFVFQRRRGGGNAESESDSGGGGSLQEQQLQQQANDKEEETYEEVVSCDGCGNAINTTGSPKTGSGGGGSRDDGGVIWSCQQCFDYDLCGKCYSRGRNDHSTVTYVGHTFKRTDAAYQSQLEFG